MVQSFKSVLNNGKITQIKKMGLGVRDDNLVTFNIPDGYHNNGFEETIMMKT